jgi:hypothetical protein
MTWDMHSPLDGSRRESLEQVLGLQSAQQPCAEANSLRTIKYLPELVSGVVASKEMHILAHEAATLALDRSLDGVMVHYTGRQHRCHKMTTCNA